MSTIEEDECPHGMEDPSWCSICKHKGDIVVVVDDDEYNFTARFDGHCGECNLPISVGQRCRHLSNGRNVHENC